MDLSLAPAPALPAARRVLARARASWRRALLLRVLAASLALLLGAAALLLAIDLLHPLAAPARALLRWLPLAAAAGPPLLALRRLVPGPDDRRLALLVEERHPQLESALSTLFDAAGDGPVARAFRARAEALLGGVDGAGVAPLRLRRPASALALATAVLPLLLALAPGGPAGAWQRWALLLETGAAGAAGARTAAATPAGAAGATPAGGLAAARLTVEPPAYSGLPAREWEGEGLLAALPGSRIRARGVAAGGAEVRARVIGGAELAVRSADGWSVEWTLGAAERGLELEAVGGGEVVGRRIVPLLALADHPPTLELTEPAEDLVVAAPRGTIVVRASATDDHGVAGFHLGWIRSRGSGESFSFEEGRWAWDALERAGRTVRGAHRLDLGALGLRPGDVLHLRAVARDGNTVTGPGEGVSRTRMIRIAREDEMAEVTTLTGFPIEAEREPVLSQRMIILLTERLLARAPGLERDALFREAAGVADEQARLREQVGDQALAPTTGAEEAHDHEAHDHDADPILGVNRPLLEAYNLMWSAEGSLRIAELRESLPFQYEALRILQEMRQAERVFLRGRQPVAPIDVAAARGTGKMEGVEPVGRTAGSPAPSARGRLAELEALLPRLRALEPQAASVELGGLAARLLADPAVDAGSAALVVRAAEAARLGQPGEAARLLVRARALLAPGGAVEGATLAPAAPGGDPRAAEYFRNLGARRP
jgi:hypothetical protein